MSLNQWLDEWLELCATRGLRPSTVEGYRTMLRLYVTDQFATTALASVSASELNTLYGRLLRQGRRNGRGGLSARTVRYLHTILRRALADAVRHGHIVINPAGAADPPSARAARAPVFRVWSPEELGRFLRSAKEDTHYAAFHLAASTGLRRSELLGLRWCDLDEASGELHVLQVLVEVAHEARLSPPKTERSRRVVALDAKTCDVLAKHRADVAARRLSVDACDLVFTSDEGKPIHPAVFSYYFQRRVKLAGVPRIRLHDLRHTHATNALQAGIHPKIVSERLGHSSITVTLDVYTHVMPTMQRDAAEAVAALLQ